MNKHDATEALLSGYIDGELTPEETARVKEMLEASPETRALYDELCLVAEATDALCIEDPPEAVWDTFLDEVYNRVERRTGWVILLAGLVGVALLALYLYVTISWGPTWERILLAAPFIGVFILFVSVLRQRLFVLPTDRYSRDVKR